MGVSRKLRKQMTERFPLGEELLRTAVLYELGAKSSRRRVESVVDRFGMDLSRQPMVKIFPSNGLVFGLTNQRLWIYETDKHRRKVRPVVAVELSLLSVDWLTHRASRQCSVLFSAPGGRYLACESAKLEAITARSFARRVRKAIAVVTPAMSAPAPTPSAAA